MYWKMDGKYDQVKCQWRNYQGSGIVCYLLDLNVYIQASEVDVIWM